MTWSHHINHIKLKISKVIAIFNKLSRLVPIESLRMLLFTFVQPHIDFNLLIWGT